MAEIVGQLGNPAPFFGLGVFGPPPGITLGGVTITQVGNVNGDATALLGALSITFSGAVTPVTVPVPTPEPETTVHNVIVIPQTVRYATAPAAVQVTREVVPA